MLGLGSYTFRWSIGHKGLVPQNPMSAFELLDVAMKHNLSVVQFADNLPLHTLKSDELDLLFYKAQQNGISLEIGTQSFNVDQVRQYIEIGRRVGAKILRVALDGPDAQKPIAALAAEFSSVIPSAKDAGLRIAIENHFNYPSRQMLTLLEAINDPQIGVCLDVANSICAGEWPEETIGILAPSTINLHLKDYVIVPDPYGVGFVIHGAPLGQGCSDCQAVLDALPNFSEMSVILEHWLPHGGDLDAACKNEHVWLEKSVAYATSQLGLK